MDTTSHRIHLTDATAMNALDPGSIDLVVTSPPYPMIAMWDAGFAAVDPQIGESLDRGDGPAAFEAMHRQLDAVWTECLRVLRPGGLLCINVGDATRKIGEEFRLFSNHARILRHLMSIGFSILPDVIWRKPTNAPNKFLGSGMLPAGAYVTYEHEYVLIARNGGPRAFKATADRERRRRSAFFWEERNVWFSDVWTDLRGAAQQVTDPAARERSAAFPFELAHRLVQMHSLQRDTVLDPFAGTGTTLAAALASGRHGVGFERDTTLAETIRETLRSAVELGRERAAARLGSHEDFVAARRQAGKTLRHRNHVYGFPVVTAQEVALQLVAPTSLEAVTPTEFAASVAVVGRDEADVSSA